MKDILLVEGNNQLNVQMVPIAPPVEFATADVTAFGYPGPVELVGVLVEIVGIGYCITKYGYGGGFEPAPGCFIENIPPGTYNVTMSISGYKTTTMPITFKPGEMRFFFYRLYKED